ncbi:hypothetical protein L1987_04626 [Smallanthus sonchifolius]|uniref:Uncharacterized protein n=1 Tax=Smallanthus sonchifolius TaxID=185202 RepID=A0ACB9JT79_9ASTR|nr:hypothetical protein L1987_04626 [Smallanthus sonchifolius]
MHQKQTFLFSLLYPFDNQHVLLCFQLVECPSIYEMLPNPKFEWEKQPEILVWKKDQKNGEDLVKLETCGTSGCVGLFVEALKNNESAICFLFRRESTTAPELRVLTVVTGTPSFFTGLTISDKFVMNTIAK